jgi:hypothetical protein
MLESTEAASPKTGVGIGPKWISKVAWFIRITGVLILLTSTAAIIQAGWPHSLRASGSLLDLFNGTLLFVVSFLFVTTGRTKIIVSAVTIVLGVWVMVFSLAKLGLPHLSLLTSDLDGFCRPTRQPDPSRRLSAVLRGAAVG